MSRLTLALVGLVALGCAPRIQVGTACTRPSDCEAPLSCLLGRCRNACESDRDCPANGTCVPAGDGLGACTYDLENECTAEVCEAPLSCVEGRCRAACSDDDDCLESQRCDGATCRPAESVDGGERDAGDDGGGSDGGGDAGMLDGGPDAPTSVVPARLCPGGCVGDEVCASDHAPTVCHTPCDSHDDCAAPSACDYYTVAGERVYGCSVVCRPGTAEGCPPGSACRQGFFAGDGIPDGPLAITFCSPIDATGEDGCACEDTDSSSECGLGLACEMPAVGRMCLRICAIGTECSPGVDCVPGARPVVVDAVQYGICPRPDLSAPLDCD